MLPLEADNYFIPSTLCAPTRESVTEYLYRFFGIEPTDALGKQLLRSAIAGNRDEGIELEPNDLLFGQAALDCYLADPEFVYYVKSPKSFLGVNGLHDVQVRFFEDLVCAMMVILNASLKLLYNKLLLKQLLVVRLIFRGSIATEQTSRLKVFYIGRQNGPDFMMWFFSLSRLLPDWIMKAS